MRRGHHDAATGGDGRVEQSGAVGFLQHREVGRVRARPQHERLQRLARGGAQHVAMQARARGRVERRVGELEVAAGHPRLARIQPLP